MDEVKPGSTASDTGLRRGDIIQEVNRKPVASISEFQRAPREPGKDAIVLLINRHGNTLYLVVEP